MALSNLKIANFFLYCLDELKVKGTNRELAVATVRSIRTSLGQLYKDQIAEGIIQACDVEFPTTMPGVSDHIYARAREQQIARETAPVQNRANSRQVSGAPCSAKHHLAPIGSIHTYWNCQHDFVDKRSTPLVLSPALCTCTGI